MEPQDLEPIKPNPKPETGYQDVHPPPPPALAESPSSSSSTLSTNCINPYPGLLFRVSGLGYRGLGFRVQGLAFRVQGSGFRVQALGLGLIDLYPRLLFRARLGFRA